MTYSNRQIGIIFLDENGEYVAAHKIGTTETIKFNGVNKDYAFDQVMLNNSNKGIAIYDKKMKLFSVNISEETGEISSEIIKEINLNIKDSEDDTSLEDNRNVFFGEAHITSDNSKLIILAGFFRGSLSNNPRVAVFDISNISQLEDAATINPIQLYNPRMIEGTSSNSVALFLNKDSTMVRLFKTVAEKKSDESVEFPMKSATTTSNGRTLMGVKYKGIYFYR